MRIVKNLQNFLLDQEYYIDIYKNIIHIYYYLDLVYLSSTKIELKLKEFNLIISGDNLTIKAMDNLEMLIKGIITKMEFKR